MAIYIREPPSNNKGRILTGFSQFNKIHGQKMIADFLTVHLCKKVDRYVRERTKVDQDEAVRCLTVLFGDKIEDIVQGVMKSIDPSVKSKMNRITERIQDVISSYLDRKIEKKTWDDEFETCSRRYLDILKSSEYDGLFVEIYHPILNTIFDRSGQAVVEYHGQWVILDKNGRLMIDSNGNIMDDCLEKFLTHKDTVRGYLSFKTAMVYFEKLNKHLEKVDATGNQELAKVISSKCSSKDLSLSKVYEDKITEIQLKKYKDKRNDSFLKDEDVIEFIQLARALDSIIIPEQYNNKGTNSTIYFGPDNIVYYLERYFNIDPSIENGNISFRFRNEPVDVLLLTKDSIASGNRICRAVNGAIGPTVSYKPHIYQCNVLDTVFRIKTYPEVSTVTNAVNADDNFNNFILVIDAEGMGAIGITRLISDIKSEERFVIKRKILKDNKKPVPNCIGHVICGSACGGMTEYPALTDDVIRDIVTDQMAYDVQRIIDVLSLAIPAEPILKGVFERIIDEGLERIDKINTLSI